MEKKLFIAVSVLFAFLAVTFIGLLAFGQPETAVPAADFGPGGLPSGSPANEAQAPLDASPSSTPKADVVAGMVDQGDGSISVTLIGWPASSTGLTCRLLKNEGGSAELTQAPTKPVSNDRCEFGNLPIGIYQIDFFDGSSVIASEEVELVLPGASMISSVQANVKPACQDSDNGLMPTQKGAALDGVGQPARDYCLDATTLREYSCLSGQIASSDIDCPGGCSDGACNQ